MHPSQRIRVLIATLATGCCLAVFGTSASLKSGIDRANFDPRVRPQDDFYRYVNGGWLSRNPIPADAVRVSAASQISDTTQAQLRKIVESTEPTKDPDLKKMAALYASFMDEAAAEHQGLRPLHAELSRIDALGKPRDIAELIGQLGQIGVRVPIANSILNDSHDANAYVQTLHQWGLGMPGRNYYLNDEPRVKQIRAAYLVHVGRMLRLSGDKNAEAGAKAVLALETTLARAQWSIADDSDPVKTDNRYTLATLQAFAPGFDWKAFLAANETLGHSDSFVVSEPSYFRALADLAAGTPLSAWKSYFRYQLLSAYAPYLSKDLVDEGFDFEARQLRGVRENAPRWKRGVNLVDESMGDALGRVYVERYVSPQAKVRIAAMLRDFIAAFDQDIETLSWMSPQAQKKAQAKLRALHAKIAYPDQWRNFGSFKIDRKDLVGNVQRAHRFEYLRNVHKLGKPVDRDEWYMTPQTPDAYEWLPQNEIVVGAALLHAPFFDPDADDAVNYGAIGGTLGHEMSHGFDNIGSQYDAKGKLLGKPGWFTPQDQENFDALTQDLVAQYSAFEPLPGYRVDGAQTLSENIADVAGAAIAYRAYHISLRGREPPTIDGLTGDQRFFIGWAQRRRGNYRDEEMIRILKSDEHAPPQVRAVAPLMNLDAFHQAFGIKPGDRMYLAPERRVKIW
jgi:putative endopeptidase